MTGGKEERGGSAGRGMARSGECWGLDGRCRHMRLMVWIRERKSNSYMLLDNYRGSWESLWELL
jgi:hypothetical protein